MTDAPGWDAIDTALTERHGDQKPLHWGTLIRWSLGGNEPLDGISAYRVDGAEPHWHLVSYGLTDLYADKETDDPDTSGFGFELTFRLARRADEEQPPAWALGLLQTLARYVFQTGNVFRPTHHIDMKRPITDDPATALTAVLFMADPELPAVVGPHGRFDFVQIIGITRDELEAINDWDSNHFAGVLAARSPLLITDLARRSLLDDPDAAAAIAAGIARDGSALHDVYVARVDVEAEAAGTTLTVEAAAAHRIAAAMRGRIGFGRPVTVHGNERAVRFEPAERAGIDRDDDELVIAATPDLAREIAAALTGAGPGAHTFASLPELAIRVV